MWLWAGLLSLSTADWSLEERADLLTSLGPATMDDDRYVMAAVMTPPPSLLPSSLPRAPLPTDSWLWELQ